MVNKKTDRIMVLLDMLRNASGPVSGEKIAESLGVSRVAVWKIISRLNEKGYIIESAKSGYRLISSADKPLPWEMTDTVAEIEYFNELDSTMAKAAVLLESGCSDGTTVIAGTQTSGRASDGRGWKSPEGGLYLTRIRTTPFPAALSGLYPLAVCCAVIDTVRSLTGIEAGIEWPAEICSKGKKIGGVLTEFRGRNGVAISMTAGVGLNVNTGKSLLPADAVSISEIAGRPVSIRELAAGLIESIDKYDRFIPEKADALISICERNLSFTGRKIEAILADRSIVEGTASGLNPDGSVRLDATGQSAVSVYSGDIIKHEQ